MIRSFRSNALSRYWTKGQIKGIGTQWANRIKINLSRLDAAARPDDMNLPGLGFHPLKGNLKGRYAVTVSRNWRITFAFQGEDAVDVDLEDYHGS